MEWGWKSEELASFFLKKTVILSYKFDGRIVREIDLVCKSLI